MTGISPARGASTTKNYHRAELVQDKGREEGKTYGVWMGRLAEHLNLTGEAHQIHVDRLADGQHPHTGEQLIRSQPPREVTTKTGHVKTSMGHRSSYELTVSAPKSVSIVAVVGGDERARKAHHESSTIAYKTWEKSTQAHSTNGKVPEMTGNWIGVRFSHDDARPVGGYSAPQLHEHLSVFNMTVAADGRVRAIEPREIFNAQSMITSIYRSELSHRLKELGYELEKGKSGQMEIRGFTESQLREESHRRQQIEEAGRSQFAVYHNREAKTDTTRESPHREVAQAVVQQSFTAAQARDVTRGLASVTNAEQRAQAMQQLAPQGQPAQAKEPEKASRGDLQGKASPKSYAPNSHLRTPWATPQPKKQDIGMER